MARWEHVQTKYKDYILQNPEIASKMEGMLRLLSYVLPGRFGASDALSELLYSASQLLSLMHDGVFRMGKGIPDYREGDQGNQLVLWLTIIEYLEVFIELGAEKVFGEPGKWLIVIVVQVIKAALRLVLLFSYKSGIQRAPLIPPLDRKSVFPEKQDGENEIKTPEEEKKPKEPQSPVWKGTRTGRPMRKLVATPNDGFRSWELPPSPKDDHVEIGPSSPTELSTKRLVAETLHITRPLLHLSSMFVFGQNSWKPWLLAYGTDVMSLCLHRNIKELNAKEQSEMSRRTLLLAFYFLRSPFYDKYSKAKIINMLRFLSNHIPGMSILVAPMLDYLPTWQRIYFYNWTS
ncbi:predicted protein [Nematostella vectensis]|uniref:Peroxisomal membrane protein PEX16 n=1 Tax=Nematostella vectensis TaxID=45351 RepID=A7SVU6_NEMVE|nr:predicted protein [Nematostella vectensis]|eukprot:XP_001624274.1 predicted protein [Nematostella vectensis]